MLTPHLNRFALRARRSCDSNFVCGCVDQSQFAEWYALDCTAASNSTFSDNATGVTNATILDTTQTPPSTTMFDNVDPFLILVSLVTGLAMLALIALSVLFARYSKRNKVVVMLEGGIELANEQKANAEAFNKELKASLERAQKEVDKAVVGDADELLKQYKIKHAELTFQDEIGHGQVLRLARSQKLKLLANLTLSSHARDTGRSASCGRACSGSIRWPSRRAASRKSPQEWCVSSWAS